MDQPVRAARNRPFPAKAFGGKDDIDNLVPACKMCNQSKGDQPLEEWKVGRAAGGYELGSGFLRGAGFAWGGINGPLWFETEDFRAAMYDSRRACVIERWKQGQREFNSEFVLFPRYAPEVCRPHGLIYDYVWYDGRWVLESWAREQEENKKRGESRSE